MEKLVVNKSGMAYASNGSGGTVTLDTINNLAHGAVACFTEAGALIASGTTGFSEATIWQGNSETGPICMGTIYPREFKYSTSANVAAAVKKMCIGNNVTGESTYSINLPTILVGGTVGGIQIIDLSKRHDDGSRVRNYEEVAIAGETHTQYMARLIAKINADTRKCIASATAVTGPAYTNGVAFVGAAGVNFSVATSGILSNSDIIAYTEVLVAKSSGVTKGYVAGLTTANLQLFAIGANLYSQLRQLELDTNAYIGDQGLTTARGTKIFTLSSRLETGVTYKTVTIECKAPNNISNLIEVTNPISKWTFALASTDTVVSAVLTNLNTVLNAASY